MTFDPSVPQQQTKVPAGTLLFAEDSSASTLNVLHGGTICYLTEVPGGRKLELFKLNGANLTPGSVALFTNGRYPFHIQAEEACVISTYTMNRDTIGKSVGSRVSLGLMVARTLLREITELFKKSNQIRKITSDIEKVNDNLSILYYQFNPSVFPDIKPGSPIPEISADVVDPVMRLCRENLKLFFDNGGLLPDRPSPQFLEEEHESQLTRLYPEEIDFQDGEFGFIRKLIVQDPKVLNVLFAADSSMLLYVCSKLANVLDQISGILKTCLTDLDEAFRRFFVGESSLVEKFYLILDITMSGYGTAPVEYVVPVLGAIAGKIEKYKNGHQALFGIPVANLSPNTQAFQSKASSLMKKFEETSPKVQTPSPSSVAAGVDINAIRQELDNSASVIIQFSGLEAEKVKEFSALMVKVKSLKNPLDPEGDNRKIRRTLGRHYWDMYQECFVKYMNSNRNVPKAVELMLKYGYFDETMVDDSQIAFMYTQKDSANPASDIPISLGTEWLEKVYKREVPTSLDEMGQNFFEKVKLENRNLPIKKESDIPPELDNPDTRLKFEFASLYEANVRLTSGSPATHFPILTKFHSQMAIDKSYVSKEILREVIQELMGIDYSVFHREVIYNNNELGITKEFIQKCVIPDFILVPSIGTKVMMWQDLSIHRGAGSKESPGRIVLPIFAQGDLKTMVADALAAFRWELTKSILGAEWNNVGNPSITADYTDYIQFFKKNKDLSMEIKEKLASDFKRFRNDRDIFANDYQLWMKYEADGVQRLNKVVRGIFYRHIPFSRQVREKVAKTPAFAEIHNRFINIRNRKYIEIENRYKKYLNALGSLPDPLRDNLEFYRV
ncbi:cyclic nucleotide-binding domain-containing protein [Leptospira borgpetersenii]|uniref:cAMP-dependent protein kinase n=1 Tax=Leptospira borgpetersenii serovar Hardjo-bovis (strain JB197) TaxID=355277 RepID=Q04UE1_LEPBJ|nr:cyclic nucleotide-binding domain-containing protein [Leptospira borgpetersenii]ABJ75479.1 cAMP-dependent protein kinase [Leptospira borgpetersenii serovar Hardjo-bovis str. JB197]AMX70587.1 cAMP-binding protein [Leptospira borgpetersenii serovar Hardjo]TQE56217.1 Crp/Fnr family transcriptional regulator [Leptospira borgpetersenii]